MCKVIQLRRYYQTFFSSLKRLFQTSTTTKKVSDFFTVTIIQNIIDLSRLLKSCKSHKIYLHFCCRYILRAIHSTSFNIPNLLYCNAIANIIFWEIIVSLFFPTIFYKLILKIIKNN